MVDASNFKPVMVDTLTATIPVGSTESNIIDLKGTTLAGYELPTEFDGTEIGFTASIDGVNFSTVYDPDGNTITHTVASDRTVIVPVNEFAGLRHMKFVAATAQTTTSTVIKVICRPV